MDKRYHLQKIRTLLSEGFTPEELRRLCQDEPSFRPVCHQLTRNSSKAEIIDLIIEHADRMLQFETLLTWVKQNNPARYNLHQPYSSPPDLPASSDVPAEANSGASPQAVGESGVPDTSPRNSVPGIPSHLSGRLRQALLDCGPFDNDRQLRAVFADARLSPWRDSLPQADSRSDRVDASIAFLVEKSRSDTGENALVLLLRVLSERINPGDACYQQLKNLANELEAALGGGPLPPQSVDAPGLTRGALVIGNSTPSLLPLGPIRNRWALLVGINRYVDPTFKPLNFCVADVLALTDSLKKAGYTVVTLHDQATEERLQPDNENIEAELIRLCQVAQPEDLLWVHFACHGQVLNGQPILITRRTRQTTLAKSALPLAEVERQMRASQARRLVLTLDACHVGVEIGRGSSDPEFIRHAHDLAEGFALIAASTAQQKAQEWQAEQHGVFTYYLLAGLNGQAARGQPFVTVDDLKTYVLDHLRRWSVENGGLLQEPSARTEGLGDMILADFREQRPGGA